MDKDRVAGRREAPVAAQCWKFLLDYDSQNHRPRINEARLRVAIELSQTVEGGMARRYFEV